MGEERERKERRGAMGDRTAVLDLGSYSIKAGHAHSVIGVEADLPPLVTPTRVRVFDLTPEYEPQEGKARNEAQRPRPGIEGNAGQGEEEEGKSNGALRGTYVESRPVQNGVITDWDQMEALWHYILYEQLGWEKGNEGSVLITEKVLASSKLQRELTTQIMFEKFNTNGLYMANQARLSLAAYGKISGCVVDVGHGNIGVSCVTEGQLQQHSCASLPFGGEQLTEFLRKAVRGTSGDQLSDQQLADLKQECAEVCSSTEDYKTAIQSCEEREHILPDGSTVTIGKEAKQAGEILFQPHLFGYKGMSLVDMIHTSIFSVADLPMKRMLSENLLVAGCGSVMNGLEQRILNEMRCTFPPSYMPSTLRRPEYMPQTCPMYSAWVGGFIEAKLAFSQNQQITKYDYDEYGPGIIHKKAFL